MSEMQPLGRERVAQHRQDIGAMRRKEQPFAAWPFHLTDFAEQQRAAVLPAALPPGVDCDAKAFDSRAETELVQHASSIRREHDAGADFAQRLDLLIDMNVEASMQQAQSGGKAADAAADHSYFRRARRHTIP